MSTLDKKIWWTYEDVAEYLSISKSAAYSLVCEERIPYFRQGGIVRFRQVEIDHWLEEGMGAPTSRKMKKGENNGHADPEKR